MYTCELFEVEISGWPCVLAPFDDNSGSKLAIMALVPPLDDMIVFPINYLCILFFTEKNWRNFISLELFYSVAHDGSHYWLRKSSWKI